MWLLCQSGQEPTPDRSQALRHAQVWLHDTAWLADQNKPTILPTPYLLIPFGFYYKQPLFSCTLSWSAFVMGTVIIYCEVGTPLCMFFKHPNTWTLLPVSAINRHIFGNINKQAFKSKTHSIYIKMLKINNGGDKDKYVDTIDNVMLNYLSPKHVKEFICMVNWHFYINCVHLVVCMDYYSHYSRNK